jgi:hypothetical protein
MTVITCQIFHFYKIFVFVKKMIFFFSLIAVFFCATKILSTSFYTLDKTARVFRDDGSPSKSCAVKIKPLFFILWSGRKYSFVPSNRDYGPYFFRILRHTVRPEKEVYTSHTCSGHCKTKLSVSTAQQCMLE